ncbi:hypothetical protein BGO17_04235 [Candidatus Saccharibacteria bacterium 49-20]|nr:MAG: hypothetical protein BGO17_04235 [Candidatus Saccharibacteria bacterium 49-20]
MNLLEHESKQLLSASQIPVPLGKILTKDQVQEVSLPAVLKSQVPTGGRGKAGGILIIDTQEKLEEAAKKLFNLEIKGHLPQVLLAEEKLAIARELYLSLLIDRKTSSLKLIAHTNGGVEVEENKDFASWLVDYSKPDINTLGQALAEYFILEDKTFVLQDLIENLITCFKQNDATLIEINPLVVTEDGKIIAGDCKMTLDDAAAFRHPEWNFEAKTAEVNFVTINPEGNVATIANGAGLAMATVDAAYDAGLIPANFLDIGGGANTESLLKAFNKIIEYPNVQAIILNVFAGITRADEVARAIVEAQKSISNLPPLFIRLTGTNSDEAKEILEKNQIQMLPNLESCLKAAKESIDA